MYCKKVYSISLLLFLVVNCYKMCNVIYLHLFSFLVAAYILYAWRYSRNIFEILLRPLEISFVVWVKCVVECTAKCTAQCSGPLNSSIITAAPTNISFASVIFGSSRHFSLAMTIYSRSRKCRISCYDLF